MGENCRQKLSKAESKQLFICRERVQDVLFRCNNIADIFQKRGWIDYNLINEALPILKNLLQKLEELENIQFKLEHSQI